MTDYSVVTLAERPDLLDVSGDIISAAWPELALNDDVADRLWDRVEADFPDYQYLLLDGDGTPIAYGNCIPLIWDGTDDGLPDNGWRWKLESAFEVFDTGGTPNTLAALSITILPEAQGKGISRLMVQAMSDIGRQHGFSDLIAAVRPNHKSHYPLTDISRYIQWTNADGAPFDPWLRVHWRLGARLIKPCRHSMYVSGSVEDMERWTEMRFPDSGTYVVPGALTPVTIDREADTGTYIEPNVWMHHRLQKTT